MKPKQKSTSPTLVNQTAAAKKLGVTREHLNRVLRGHRHSRRLMSAWNELQRAA